MHNKSEMKTDQASNTDFLYWEGVFRVYFLKIKLNVDFALNPASNATARIVNF